MSTHGAVFIDPRAFSEDAIQYAKSQIVKGGRLDVVVEPPPATVAEAEEVARKLYAYAPPRPSELDYTVLFDSNTHEKDWKVRLRSSDLGNGHTLSLISDSHRSEDNTFIGRYDVVAVGGTWDHVHWGHRLMLTLAAYAARNLVVLGVTGTELLAKKKYVEALDSYEVRTEAAVSFIRYLRPGMHVQPEQMLNMYGPTIEIENLDALVVSNETSSGGQLVNEERAKLKWHPLDIIEVGLVPGGPDGEKLSSTDLRREELANGSRTKI